MKLHCFGPRGSMPAPSSRALNFYTDLYGGNTTCYFLEAGNFNVIFDMGSGAKNLGDYLMKEKKIGQDFVLLLSHYHSDHIQGIGFHTPFYIPSNTFHIHGFVPTDRDTPHYNFIEKHVEHCLTEQQSSPYFPVPHQDLPAKKLYYGHSSLFSEKILLRLENQKVVQETDLLIYNYQDPQQLLITTIPLNHPNNCLGYRIDYLGKSMAFCTDNEPLAFTNKNINKLAQGVDLLLLDGQYTQSQLQGVAQGFGHGNPELCAQQALDCQAKHLIIHHHDPSHNDSRLTQMEEHCQKAYPQLKIDFAKEGSIWNL